MVVGRIYVYPTRKAGVHQRLLISQTMLQIPTQRVENCLTLTSSVRIGPGPVVQASIIFFLATTMLQNLYLGYAVEDYGVDHVMMHNINSTAASSQYYNQQPTRAKMVNH